MKTACSCVMMVLLLAGCATTGKVDQMIDTKVGSQIEELNAQLDAQVTAQTVAAAQTLEDMKGFIDRLGTALNNDVKGLESDVAGLEAQVASVKKDVASTKSDLKGLEQTIGKQGASDDNSATSVIDSLKGKLAAINVAVEALEKSEKARTEAEASAAAAKAALPAKGLFHKHPAGAVE